MQGKEVIEIVGANVEGSCGGKVDEESASLVVGEALPINGVVRINLNVFPIVDQEQHENIFHIKFLVNGMKDLLRLC